METSKYAYSDGKSFVAVHLMPDLVILDPRLTRAKDGKTVAEAGFAAFGRILEATLRPGKSPLMHAYAFTRSAFSSGESRRSCQ